MKSVYFLDIKEFQAYHPITTYTHYQDLINRIAAGEEKLIIAEKPLILAMTSGTSGSSAMLLSTKDTNTEFFLQVKSLLDDDDDGVAHALRKEILLIILAVCFHQGVTVCLDAMQQAFPETKSLQRTTKFFYTPTFRQSEAGIPIGPNSSTPASSRHILNLYTTPAPAFKVQSASLTSGQRLCDRFGNKILCFFRFPVRRTRSICIFFLR